MGAIGRVNKRNLLKALTTGKLCHESSGPCTAYGRSLKGYCICLEAAKEIVMLRMQVTLLRDQLKRPKDA